MSNPRIDAPHAAAGNSDGPALETAEIRAAGGFDPAVLGDHFVRHAEELAVRLQMRHQQLECRRQDPVTSGPLATPPAETAPDLEAARIRLRDLANELDRQRVQLDSDFRSLHAERESMEKDKRAWAVAGGASTAPYRTKPLLESRPTLPSDDESSTSNSPTDLEKQRHQLRAFGVRLADKYREFARQREQFQQWAEQREADLQRRAEEVNGRLNDLEAEHRRHLSMQHEWSHTCRQQQRQIRHLMLQLDQLATLLDKK